MRSVATRTIRPEVEGLPAISAESIPRTGGEWRPPSESCVYRRSAYRVIMVPDGRDRAQNGPRTVGEGGRADVGPAAVAAHCPPVDLHDGSAARAGRPAGGEGGRERRRFGEELMRLFGSPEADAEEGEEDEGEGARFN